jgi:hypothetical protein
LGALLLFRPAKRFEVTRNETVGRAVIEVTDDQCDEA